MPVLSQPDAVQMDFLSAFDALLSRAELVSWQINHACREISFSDELNGWDISPPILTLDVDVFCALLSEEDQHAFWITYPSDLQVDEHAILSCYLHFQRIVEFPLHFVGSIDRAFDTVASIYRGVIYGKQHGSLNLHPEHFCYHLSSLLDYSPIPSVLTDAEGNLLYVNQSALNLFHLQAGHIRAGIAKYNLLNDQQLKNNSRAMQVLGQCYQKGRASKVELTYNLSGLHRNPDFTDAQATVIMALLPVKNAKDEVVRVLIQFQDLSQEKLARKALQHREAGYSAFIANSSEAIWCYEISPPVSCQLPVPEQKRLIAKRARLVEANQVMLRNLNIESCASSTGTGLNETISNTYLADIEKLVLHNYQLTDHNMSHVSASGKEYFYQMSCVGVVQDNSLVRIWGSSRDITTRKRYEAKLEYQSRHDALTGLPNRESLYNVIDKAIAKQVPGLRAALLLIDLDRFKEINDTLGHNVGDRLLQMIGPRLQSEMTDEKGMIARLGGDEFAVFLPQVKSVQQAVVFAHRLLDSLSLEFDLDVFCTLMSASIGIALAPDHGNNSEALLRYADIAMYHAKQEMLGVSVYCSSKDPHSHARLTMIAELGRAIRENQLQLYYQPKVNISEERCYGFEALIRWNHPTLGFISPDKFIPIAELTSLIHPLTAWVLERGIQQCRAWNDLGLMLSISINLSARNLMDENIPKLVERLLKQYGLSPARLHLEITESMMMSDPTRALRILKQLNELGVHLAIDDFGTGYSSLAYLKRLPVKTLKIDRSFVLNMLGDKQNELIVNSTVHLAHNLGLTVVAEGVETDEILQSLLAMGCDAAQGYFIARPMKGCDTVNWINNSSWKHSVIA